MDFFRLIILICSPIFLISISYVASIPRGDVTRQVHAKVSEADGPVYTFVKTDKKANIKWGVRHYVPRKN